MQISGVLSELIDDANVGKPYDAAEPRLKCLIQVVNANLQFEVAYLEVT